MSDDLSLVLERARQNRTADAGALRTSLRGSVTPTSTPGSTLRAGDRVFDLESGSTGQIVDQSTPTLHATSAIYVRLDDGRVVARPIESLVLRPTPPSAL